MIGVNKLMIGYFCRFHKAICIIKEYYLITKVNNIPQRFNSFGISSDHIFGRDIVSAVTDTVAYPCKTFFNGIQTYIIHNSIIALLLGTFECFDSTMTRKGGFLRKGKMIFKAELMLGKNLLSGENFPYILESCPRILLYIH